MLRPCRRLSSEWTSSAVAAKSYSVRCGGIDARAHENQTRILQSGPKTSLVRSIIYPPTKKSNCVRRNPVSGSVVKARILTYMEGMWLGPSFPGLPELWEYFCPVLRKLDNSIVEERNSEVEAGEESHQS